MVQALTRLLHHLEADHPCHADLNAPRQAPWKRSEKVLKCIQDNLHAIDLHPFAAFLTTANVIFFLLPHFVSARLKNPDLGLSLSIFATDSLVKHRTELDWEAFDRLNARVQLTVHSFERYEQMLKLPFAFVFGNPPWGGVLKGPLSPIFDEHKKKHFRKAFPTAAVGKYDIYGLFFARGLEFLRPGGTLALLTQNTFLEKEWARDLRRQLATRTDVHHIVDLGPYGQLFFHAMNTPCITTCRALDPDTQGSALVAIAKRARLPRLPEHARRALVVEKIRSQMAALAPERQIAEDEFCEAFAMPRSHLVSMNGDRWDLAPPGRLVVSAPPGLLLTDILEPRQGVTPGGALDIFLITKETAKHEQLEGELVHRAFKTREIDRWWVQWKDRCLLYPYRVIDGRLVPAFKVKDKAQMSSSRFHDALDFSVALDEAERALFSSTPELQERVQRVLEHRIALGLVAYPNVANYLISHYPELDGRIFKKKRLEAFGRNWYEYLWPRDDSLMIKPRLVCPGLLRPEELRFALETEGYLSDHACVFLLPSPEKAAGYDSLRKSLAQLLHSEITKLEALHYVLGFLNTGYVKGLLTYGRRPTPKGFYAVNERFLSEILIPLPSKPAPTRLLIETVAKLTAWVPDLMERRKLEDQVERLARELLSP